MRQHVNMLSTLNVKPDEDLLSWILERALPRETRTWWEETLILSPCLINHLNLFLKPLLDHTQMKRKLHAASQTAPTIAVTSASRAIFISETNRARTSMLLALLWQTRHYLIVYCARKKQMSFTNASLFWDYLFKVIGIVWRSRSCAGVVCGNTWALNILVLTASFALSTNTLLHDTSRKLNSNQIEWNRQMFLHAGSSDISA